jgi:hypothetical protein
MCGAWRACRRVLHGLLTPHCVLCAAALEGVVSRLLQCRRAGSPRNDTRLEGVLPPFVSDTPVWSYFLACLLQAIGRADYHSMPLPAFH